MPNCNACMFCYLVMVVWCSVAMLITGGLYRKGYRKKHNRIRTNVEFKQMWHTLGSPELANVFLFRHRNWNSSNRHWSSSMRPSPWSLRRPLTIGLIGGLTQPTSTSTVTFVRFSLLVIKKRIPIHGRKYAFVSHITIQIGFEREQNTSDCLCILFCITFLIL